MALGLLQIVSELLAERLREQERNAIADRIDIWARVVFLLAVLGMFLGGVIQYNRS